MKKAFGLFAVVVTLAVPAVASAENNASPSGAAHGAFASENGNFGWLGEMGGTPGYTTGPWARSRARLVTTTATSSGTRSSSSYLVALPLP
jgi:hypothetical protein